MVKLCCVANSAEIQFDVVSPVTSKKKSLMLEKFYMYCNKLHT